MLIADPVLAVAAALGFGLVAGSFLNVVIHRLPRMLERAWQAECAELAGQPATPAGQRYNLLTPASHCPHCNAPVAPVHNIPVLSYLALRGRCAHCRARISPRYPAVELGTGLAAALVAANLGLGAQGLAALALTFALIALAGIDLERLLLPDSLTLPVLWLGLLLNLGGLYVPLAEAVLGAAAGYLVLWGVYWAFRLLTGKEGLGYGDFKLLALLGAWLGWKALPLVVILASAAGALIGLALIAAGRSTRSTPLPFGPFLALAGYVALLWGDALARAYGRLLGFSV